MNTFRMSRTLLRSAVIATMAVALPAAIVVRLRADEKPPIVAPDPSPLAKAMIGTWVLVGTPDNVGEVPAKGGRFKFMTGRHWTITEADPDSGEVIHHHGGTYTLDGEDYAETVNYANQNTASLIGKTHKFKVKVEGDTFTQIGIGNPWTEVWKRAK